MQVTPIEVQDTTRNMVIFVKRIMAEVRARNITPKNTQYIKIPHNTRRALLRNNHFTRSCLQGNLAQSTVKQTIKNTSITSPIMCITNTQEQKKH